MKFGHCKRSSMRFSLKFIHFRISISRRIVRCKTRCKCSQETIFHSRMQLFPSPIPRHPSPVTLFINEEKKYKYKCISNVYILTCFACKTKAKNQEITLILTGCHKNSILIFKCLSFSIFSISTLKVFLTGR